MKYMWVVTLFGVVFFTARIRSMGKVMFSVCLSTGGGGLVWCQVQWGWAGLVSGLVGEGEGVYSPRSVGVPNIWGYSLLPWKKFGRNFFFSKIFFFPVGGPQRWGARAVRLLRSHRRTFLFSIFLKDCLRRNPEICSFANILASPTPFSDEILGDVTFCERCYVSYHSCSSVNKENRVTQAIRLTVHCYLFTDDRRKFIFMRTFNEVTWVPQLCT